ncbi:MAG: hypothetical protein ACMXYK_02480 [Candidatus Woesearchaeota archaeon]
MRPNQINWIKILKKSFEDAIKKTIELTILVLILGVSIRIIMITVPAVGISSMLSKTFKLLLFE